MDLWGLKLSLEDRRAPLAARVPVSPNALTGFALAAMVAGGLLPTQRRPVAAGAPVLASGFLDLPDGAVARAQGRETPFGAPLDRVADRASDLAVLAGAAAGGYAGLFLNFFVVGSVLLASYESACREAMIRSRIGEALSLRGGRVGVLAATCFLDAVGARPVRARRLLA